MKTCKNCGTNIEQGDLFCPNCGNKQDNMPQENYNGEIKYNLNQNKQKINYNFKCLKDIAILMCIKPIDSAKNYVEKVNKERECR